MSLPSLYSARDLETPICVPYEAGLALVEQGSIEDQHGLMRWGSNYTFLVTAQHEEMALLAIYKPRAGERPLWDFEDGTLCQREMAAYVVSHALGWHIVPPTALRDGPHGIGSVQIFIQHDPQRHYFTLTEEHEAQLRRIALFDALTNNADRKGGHCLLDESGHLWGIDHGLTFNTQHKLRTVIWDFAGQEIAAPLYADLERFCRELETAGSPALTKLEPLLSAAELRALRTRAARLLKSGKYPLPGPGPNRPWPAV